MFCKQTCLYILEFTHRQYIHIYQYYMVFVYLLDLLHLVKELIKYCLNHFLSSVNQMDVAGMYR